MSNNTCPHASSVTTYIDCLNACDNTYACTQTCKEQAHTPIICKLNPVVINRGTSPMRTIQGIQSIQVSTSQNATDAPCTQTTTNQSVMTCLNNCDDDVACRQACKINGIICSNYPNIIKHNSSQSATLTLFSSM
jgi:hypothetical protein